MRGLLAALVVVSLAPAAFAGDPPLDAKVEEARARLFEVLTDEAKVPERLKAVLDLAALDTVPAAKLFAEALEKLAARTTQAEASAARTRAAYEPYKGAAQANDRDWQVKQRLVLQMEKEDALLRNDAQVLDGFSAALAAMKAKDAIAVVDRAGLKSDLPASRRVVVSGLLRNPATNGAEVAKRAMADADAAVRLAALLALAERHDVALSDFAVKALTDPEWTFRQAAARALGAMGDTKSVGPLIAAMAGEEGRLLEDFAEVLAKLTGAQLGPNPEAWKRWYDDHKAELAAKGARPAAPKLGKNPLAPPVDYYGVVTRSLKLLFLIDCSGSMNESLGQAGVTTGERFEGPKIDIAKRMLKAAISQLHPSTEFDVIIFDNEARSLSQGRLVVATDANKFAVMEQVDALVARGGTYTYGALKLAFGLASPNVTPTRPPVDTIFLLSDGAPTETTTEDSVEAKPMDPAKILDSVAKWNGFRAVRIHTIAIDPRIEKTGGNFVRFMRDLAEQNGGTYTPIGK